MFILWYSVVAGVGFGLNYNLPLKVAWSYFPKHQTLVSGIILSCYSINAIIACTISTQIVNPDNAPPEVKVHIGHSVESFYEHDSEQVKQLSKMLTRLAEIIMCLFVISLPFL